MSSGGAAPDSVAEDLRTYGASETEIQRWQAEQKTELAVELVELPEDCRDALVAFLAVDTQWRRIVAGTRLFPIGLDYAGVRAAFALQRQRLAPELFADLQMMEREVLDASAGG